MKLVTNPLKKMKKKIFIKVINFKLWDLEWIFPKNKRFRMNIFLPKKKKIKNKTKLFISSVQTQKTQTISSTPETLHTSTPASHLLPSLVLSLSEIGGNVRQQQVNSVGVFTWWDSYPYFHFPTYQIHYHLYLCL